MLLGTDTFNWALPHTETSDQATHGSQSRRGSSAHFLGRSALLDPPHTQLRRPLSWPIARSPKYSHRSISMTSDWLQVASQNPELPLSMSECLGTAPCARAPSRRPTPSLLTTRQVAIASLAHLAPRLYVPVDGRSAGVAICSAMAPVRRPQPSGQGRCEGTHLALAVLVAPRAHTNTKYRYVMDTNVWFCGRYGRGRMYLKTPAASVARRNRGTGAVLQLLQQFADESCPIADPPRVDYAVVGKI